MGGGGFWVSGVETLDLLNNRSPSVTRATLYVRSARARPQIFLIPEKTASVKRLDAVLGTVNCAMVIRTGAFIVFCTSEESPQTSIHSSTNTCFSMSRWLGSSLRTIDPLCHFSSSLGLSSAGVTPLPPCSGKLLDETVQTFTVFPSWLHLLDGEDNCMLSVPFCTSDLHYDCWQSGEKLTGGGRRGFHVAVLRILVFFEGLLLSLFFYVFFVVLPTRCLLDVSPLSGLTLRFRSGCLLLPQGFLDTREAGICAGSRAWSSFSFSSFGSAHDDMCQVT